MPTAHPSANPFRNRQLRDAAAVGQLLQVHCTRCRRSANYWASDLVKVLGPNHEAHVAPFDCSRCRTRDHLRVTLTVPSAATLDSLTVRRPVKQITRWIWRDEKA